MEFIIRLITANLWFKISLLLVALVDKDLKSINSFNFFFLIIFCVGLNNYIINAIEKSVIIANLKKEEENQEDGIL